MPIQVFNFQGGCASTLRGIASKEIILELAGKPEAFRHVLRRSREDRLMQFQGSSSKPSSTIEVTRTYLEMRSASDLQAARNYDPPIQIEPQPDCSIDLFRFLYAEVGRNYHWIDRLPWTDEQISEHLAKSENTIWLMTYDGEMAGYFELRKCEDGATELAYFGLLPQFIGRGLGKHLLTCATEQAWNDGANRVWLHTCTLDDPAALPNYLKRGFKSFKTEKYTVER